MNRVLPGILAAALAGCGSEPTAPPLPTSEAPAIETASVPSSTAAPAPIAGSSPEPPSAREPLPARLTLAQIEKTFAHHRRFFEKIYTAHRQAQPNLGGTLLISFTVKADGIARGAAIVDSSVGNRGFEQAVLQQVEQMTFPPATDATPVERFSLQFSAGTP